MKELYNSSRNAMDRTWVERQIEALSLGIGLPNQRPPIHYFYEPTNQVYDSLGTGYETDLQRIADEISAHLNVPCVPSCRYSWSITMEPEVAGQCKLSDEDLCIQIPFSCVGNKYAVGSILSHEMAHIVLLLKGLCIADHDENEMLTDLTAIYIGLGKLLLNGIVSPLNDHSNRARVLGYLPFDLMLYSYAMINKTFSIDSQIALANLLPYVQKRIIDLIEQH